MVRRESGSVLRRPVINALAEINGATSSIRDNDIMTIMEVNPKINDARPEMHKYVGDMSLHRWLFFGTF